jgi:RecA-family ATPase
MNNKKEAVSKSPMLVDVKQASINNTNKIISNLVIDGNMESEIFDETKVLNQEKSAFEELLHTISMTELLDNSYPPKLPIIDGLLYNGIYLFAGTPKIGKSFLMAQLGYHVSMGLPLWDYHVHKGTVLYLALEDDCARLQNRMYHMYGNEPSENLYFATEAKTLNDGMEQQLNKFINQYKDIKLIIIDTLQKVRDGNGDKCSYSFDYEFVTKLKNFSDKHEICMIVVHHTRKMESSDIFEMISGSNGLLGAADGAFVMQKESRTSKKAVLDVVGRDQPSQKLFLEFDETRLIWNLTKTESELTKESVDPIIESVAKVMFDRKSTWCGTATELLKLMPEVNMQAHLLTRKINCQQDQLLNEYGIKYKSERNCKCRKITLEIVNN